MRSARPPALRQRKATHGVVPPRDRQYQRYKKNYRSRIPLPWPTNPKPWPPIKTLLPPSQPPMQRSPQKWVPQLPLLRSYSIIWRPVPVPPTNDQNTSEEKIRDVIHWTQPVTAGPMAMQSESPITAAPTNTRCHSIKNGNKGVNHGWQHQKKTRRVTWGRGP